MQFRIKSMSWPFARARSVYALILMGGLAGALFAVQLTISSAHDDTDALAETIGCGGAAVSFVGAESLSDLGARADLVVRGRVTGREVVSDQFEIEGADPTRSRFSETWVVHEVEVFEVFFGTPTAKTVQVGDSFGYCMDVDEEYHLFLGQDRSAPEVYLDQSSEYQNPAMYGFRSFGPANVFAIEPDGSVHAESGFVVDGVAKYDGVSDSKFRSDLATALAGAN